MRHLVESQLQPAYVIGADEPAPWAHTYCDGCCGLVFDPADAHRIPRPRGLNWSPWLIDHPGR
ncbi:hypothetical protein [Nocardioides sp.]|uniref:hypothetical protein n=1 Tax=Nocardioides sp. TaxID=35761 RepID=UPI003511EF1E